MTVADVGRVLVVGGGVAAARSCQQLRKQGHCGPVTLITTDSRLPYDLPPLTKEVLRGDRDDTELKIDWDGLDVEVCHSVTATHLDVDNRLVNAVTRNGQSVTLPFDALVIATGSTPIRLSEDPAGVQRVVRTIDDALALRKLLAPGQRVCIIGASWIGAEVATAALAAGAAVTCIEAGPSPLAAAIGDVVGQRLIPWWDGIDLRCGRTVVAITDSGIRLDNGDFIGADVIVSGVGVTPNTSWLASSGLELDRGVVVDGSLRVRHKGAPVDHIVAVGDVAAWYSQRFKCVMRLGHWDDAATAPTVAAATLLNTGSDTATTHDPVPYFWSDQFGHKLQYVGHHDQECSLYVRQPTDGSSGWTACWLGSDQRLMAVLAADRPKDMVMGRKAIAASRQFDVNTISDPSLPLA